MNHFIAPGLLMVAFFLMAAICGVSAVLLFWRELRDVNQKLPPSERISYWCVGKGMVRVRDRYKQLYPSGRLDFWRAFLLTGAFAFGILALVAAIFYGRSISPKLSSLEVHGRTSFFYGRN
jgi:hypothetical protein